MVPLRWSDSDVYGHVNNVMLLRLLEEARVSALEPDFLEGGLSAGAGTGLLVARQEIEYFVPLTWRAAPVAIDLWVTRIGASDFELGYEVLEEGPEGPPVVYARAETTLFAFDLAAQRPRRLAELERKKLLEWLDEPIRWRRRREKAAAPRLTCCCLIWPPFPICARSSAAPGRSTRAGRSAWSARARCWPCTPAPCTAGAGRRCSPCGCCRWPSPPNWTPRCR
nr:thioesterase family protein [Kineosporia rhizophila]